MREIIYKYNSGGSYQTEQNTSFADDSHVKLMVEPHEFSIAVGGEVLRSTSFSGCTAVVSREGEVVFYDHENNIIGREGESGGCYKEVRLIWKQDVITIQLGHIKVIDHYPNCDGEHDRWSEKWVAQRTVTLDLKSNSVVAE